MKKFLSLLMAGAMSVTLAACSSGGGQDAAPAEEGKVFNVWTWNTEFWDFLVKYYADESIDETTAKKGDVTIKRTTYPSDGGAYQDALDAALLAQADAADDEKVDMFLAEADYIIKYTDSDATMDVSTIGVTDFSNAYEYTVQAASDSNGVVKGVSFQCCPAAVIYRRSIAKDVLGSDDPEVVQEAMKDWDAFDATAAKAKDKGYYMIPTTNATYRVFSNNVTSPWVDKDGKLNIDSNIDRWMDQSKEYVDKGYTAYTSNIWGDEATSEMFASGKSMCFFGPAWYYNFSMGNAQDPEKGCSGDWAIVEGPQAYFWGGTWLLAATGTDNPTMVADIMNSFIGEDISTELVINDMQFSNNKVANQKVADDKDYGNDFLGGQNDTAVFCALADNIKFENQTQYDQLCNEGLQTYFQQYLDGEVKTKDEAIANFYDYIAQTYPSVVIPD